MTLGMTCVIASNDFVSFAELSVPETFSPGITFSKNEYVFIFLLG